jgi:hypothetical protein
VTVRKDDSNQSGVPMRAAVIIRRVKPKAAKVRASAAGLA